MITSDVVVRDPKPLRFWQRFYLVEVAKGLAVTLRHFLANLLARKSVNSTVTICHTGTADLARRCREADILVTCVGAPGLITAGMIKPGACVIDVGTTRVEDPGKKKGYRLAGDVDFEAASQVAGLITPVPGGVGPMTVTMLLANTVAAAERAAGKGAAPA